MPTFNTIYALTEHRWRVCLAQLSKFEDVAYGPAASSKSPKICLNRYIQMGRAQSRRERKDGACKANSYWVGK